MDKPVIAVACDHAGLELKSQLKETLAAYASQVLDLGTHSDESVDYCDYANALSDSILKGKAAYGVAICGSGVGVSIACNRHKGIRAALCTDGLTASLSRRHNDANVLCMGGRLIGVEVAKDCLKQFFTSSFEGGRHERRVKKLDTV